MCYEGNFGVEAFNGPFKLDEVYALLNKCFETMDGVDFELNCKILLVKFKVVVLGVFNLAFELRLKELVIADDGRLSIELEQHRQIVDELRGKMDNIIAGLIKDLSSEKKAREEMKKKADKLATDAKSMEKRITKSSNPSIGILILVARDTKIL
jgi:hypothetical protein